MTGRITEQEGRALFGLNPGGYDSVRPDYPESIYALLATENVITPHSRILEIGAGTGIATRRLLSSGAGPVTAIEPDSRFEPFLTTLGAEFAPRLLVIQSPFEEAELPSEGFDVVVSATAFHWLDPLDRVARIARALRAGGYVALWWNVFQDLTRQDHFHEATRGLLANLRVGPSDSVTQPPFALRKDERVSEFTTAGFEVVGYQETYWTLVLDPPRVGLLYESFSAIQRLPDRDRRVLLERLMDIAEKQFGGAVKRYMTSPVYVFRRTRLL